MKHIFACVGVIMLVLMSSCSYGIYESGRYSAILKPGITRSEIRAELGSPLEVIQASESMNHFATSDQFIVQGPVYDNLLAADAAMSSAMTFGLYEIKNLPEALFWKMSSRGAYKLEVFYSSELEYRHHQSSRVDTTEQGEQEAPCKNDSCVGDS